LAIIRNQVPDIDYAFECEPPYYGENLSLALDCGTQHCADELEKAYEMAAEDRFFMVPGAAVGWQSAGSNTDEMPDLPEEVEGQIQKLALFIELAHLVFINDAGLHL